MNVLILGSTSFINTLNELKTHLKFNPLSSESKKYHDAILFQDEVLKDKKQNNLIINSSAIKICVSKKKEKLSMYDSSPDNVYSKDSFKAEYQKKFDKNSSIKKMSQKYHLSIKDHITLYKYCKKKGKNYLASFFDLESLKRLDSKVNLPYIKVPSGEILSLDILNYIKNKNKKILISTGMASLYEIKKILKFFGKKKYNTFALC